MMNDPLFSDVIFVGTYHVTCFRGAPGRLVRDSGITVERNWENHEDDEEAWRIVPDPIPLTQHLEFSYAHAL